MVYLDDEAADVSVQSSLIFLIWYRRIPDFRKLTNHKIKSSVLIFFMWVIHVNVFHRIARFVICNYVKRGGSRFWLVTFNYFSLNRLNTMSINKSADNFQLILFISLQQYSFSIFALILWLWTFWFVNKWIC